MSVYLDWDSINWHSCRYASLTIRYDLNGAETLQTIKLYHIMRYLFKYSFLWKATLPNNGVVLESSINTLQNEQETAQAITLLIQGAAVTQVGLWHFQVQALLYVHYKYREKPQMQTGVESLAHEKLQTHAKVEQSLGESWHHSTRSLENKTSNS